MSKGATRAGVTKRRYDKVRFHDNGLLNVERKTGKYFKIARQNQKTSPLLRLPPELRNQIFREVFRGRKYVIDDLNPRVESSNALLAVCRQIYAETASMPWSAGTFAAKNGIEMNAWLEGLHPLRQGLVKHLEIDFERVFYSRWMRTFIIHMRCQSIHVVDIVRRMPALLSLRTIDFTASIDRHLMISRSVADIENHAAQDLRSMFADREGVTTTFKLNIASPANQKV
ncbi:hypothetical protein ACN47E_007662 [Coniothyrium glycines]